MRRAPRAPDTDASTPGRASQPAARAIYTVGHSTRPLEVFRALLAAHEVTRLVDVRSVPRSRHNPQFNRDTLPQALQRAGIGYLHAPGLGGLRKPRPDSPNAGWRNLSFRGYADYMQTEAFERSLEDVIELARGEQLALMCAEAVPWRCHRSLIADALLVRGIAVEELVDIKRRQPHRLTPFASVKGRKITYPPEQDASGDLFSSPGHHGASGGDR